MTLESEKTQSRILSEMHIGAILSFRRLSESVCMRILMVYLLMLASSVIGWMLFTCASSSLASGRMDSMSLANCLQECLWLPAVVILAGPLIVGVWIGFLLIGPGSGLIGLALLLLLSGLQYALLALALCRILRKRQWLWSIYLAAYSALTAYVFPIVAFIT